MKQILLIALMALTIKTMAFEIKTSIIIDATPQKVWEIFTNFKNLPNWSSFLTKVEGDVKEGNRIKVLVDSMKFKPKVLAFSNAKEFKWKGKLLLPGLFDGTHQFLFIDNGDGTTTFEQNEFFKGLLVPLFKKKLNTEIKSKFEQMNLALKKTVEKSNYQ